MLAMTRKVGEAFRVGDAVVKITRTDGESVKISIEAPSTMLILREELICPAPAARVNRMLRHVPRPAE